MWNGQRLRQLREKFGYTQEKLAQIIGVTYQQVWRWEAEKNEPTGTTIAKLAEVFNVSADYLLGLSDSAPGQHELNLTPIETKMINALRSGSVTEALRVLTEWTENLDNTIMDTNLVPF